MPNTGDAAASPPNDGLKKKIVDLIALLRTKFNEQYIGHRNTPQKCVITRPSLDNPGEPKELLVIVLQDIKYNNNILRLRGDAIKPADTVNGRTAARDDVCFNLVDEDPRQILESDIFGTLGVLKKKTLWQQGAYTMYKKLEGGGGDDAGGAINNNRELEKMTEYARKLKTTVNQLLPLANQLQAAVNEDVPEALQ